MNSNFPPKVYLIGAEKAGTTTLAYLLDQHKWLLVSKPKEPNYFSFEWDRGEEWYRNCFSGRNDEFLLDASTSYSMSQYTDNMGDSVPGRIFSMRPDACFIYILRNPVHRIISAYHHKVRTGLEKKKFRSAISENPEYLSASRYLDNINTYLQYFKISAFHFVDFLDIKRDCVGVAKACVEFLDLDVEEYSPILSQPKNASFSYTVLGKCLVEIFQGEAGLNVLKRNAKKIFPKSLHGLAKHLVNKEVDKLPNKDVHWLEEQLKREDWGTLYDLTGIDFRVEGTRV